MAKVELLTSKTEFKQKTNADVRNLGPIVRDYEEQISTASQTEIVLNDFVMSVDSSGNPTPEGVFQLIVDGKILTPGASNDYVFTSISNGVSKTIALNQSLDVDLNIIAQKVGITRESFPNPSSVAAEILDLKKDFAFHVYLNALKNYTLTGDQTLTFDAEVKDNNSAFNVGTNRFQPDLAGEYYIDLKCLVSSVTAATHDCLLGIRKNGVTADESFMAALSATSTSQFGKSSAIITMNGTTDYIDAYVNGGGDVNFDVPSSSSRVRMIGYKI